MKRRVLVVPELEPGTDHASLLHRLGFYYAHLKPRSITLVGDSDVREAVRSLLVDPVPRADFDPVTADRLRAVAKRVRVVSPKRDRTELSDSADLVLVWDTARTQGWDDVLKRRPKDLEVVEVDPRRCRLEGFRFAQSAFRLDPARVANFSQSTSMLRRLVDDLGGASVAYLVGTGPSARAAFDFDLSDGVRIVCNTVVLDKELMGHLKPQIVTFADPIFHFGPSAYAGRFREALASAAKEHDFHIVVTDRYVQLLASLLPELAQRIIGVGHGRPDGPINLNLGTSAVVRPVSNILTLLMMPLAATLAEEIKLIGFDGREPGETYFWKHGKSVQLHDELDGIRRVHPSFFDISYEDYYEEHLHVVEMYSHWAEAQGKRVVSLTPSHVSPLRRRGAGGPSVAGRSLTAPPAGDQVLVSVDPDWVDDFGHYEPFNQLLRNVAAANGWSFVSLTSRALLAGAEWQWPTFTHPTRSPIAGPAYSETFHTELSRALDELTGSYRRVTVVFYTANQWHLPPVLALARRARSDVRFVVNLMRAHTAIAKAVEEQDPSRSTVSTLLRESVELAESLAVTVTIDSEQINDDVEKLIGKRLPIWPMVSLVTAQPHGSRTRDGSRPTRVYAPFRPQISRGYPEFAALALAVSRGADAADFEFVARYSRQPGPVQQQIQGALADLESAGATILWGTFDDQRYVEELAAADIIVVPYRRLGIPAHDFRTHTSAVLIDAVRAGRPVVATSGTWLGSVVEHYGIGVSFAETDLDDFERAVREVAGNLEHWRKRVAEVREKFEEEFSVDRLWQFVESLPSSSSIPAAELEERARRFDQQVASLARTQVERERAAGVIRADRVGKRYERAQSTERNSLRINELKRAKRRLKRRVAARPGQEVAGRPPGKDRSGSRAKHSLSTPSVAPSRRRQLAGRALRRLRRPSRQPSTRKKPLG